MRLLHTSDWHLGASIEGASLAADHDRFFDWLIARLRDDRIDVLLVAGDVFHHSQPSAAAQEQYFRFLLRALDETPLRRLVITGGNHDSPSRLDAPRELLDALRITVVGGLDRRTSLAERCLVPIAGSSGEVELLVAALPYVPDALLGVVGTEGDLEDLRRRYDEAFRRLYGELARVGAERFPGVPRVAMGHLTCLPDRAIPPLEDHHAAIHRVGTIGALSPDIFQDSFAYTALGHIHRSLALRGAPRPIWYSGTPVGLGRDEATTRRVLLVDVLDRSTARVTPVDLPRWRELIVVDAPAAEVGDRVEAAVARAAGELPPYCFVDVRIRTDDEALRAEADLESLFAAPRMAEARLVALRFRLQREDEAESDASPEWPDLETLTAEDVFLQLCDEMLDAPPSPALLDLFRRVSAQAAGGADSFEETS